MKARSGPPDQTVLLVAPLPPPPLLGGVETGVALLLATELAATLPIELFNTARAEDPSRPLLSRLSYQLAMCSRFARRLIDVRPPIVHIKTSSGINFYQNVLYAVIARVFGKKVALQLHSGHFPIFYRDASRPGKAIIRAGVRLPHVLMVLSPSWAERLAELRGERRIAIVPNVIEAAPFKKAQPQRDRFGISSDRTVALFVGTRDARLDAQKGLADVISAVATVRRRHPELVLVLAGEACMSLDLSSELGERGDGWIAVGVVSDEAKAELYRSADIFLLPSEAENMPNSVLEAMAAGVPVIATPVGAIPEMVDDGNTGLLVPVADRIALTKAIERLVEDPGLRRRMGASAATAVEARYGVDVLERCLTAEYHSLLVD